VKAGRRNLAALSIVTVVATWLLLVIGGLVNPTGSSMACPDWYFIPTCNGEVIPADWSGGVLYEHGHRMWASGVGMLTLLLGFALWRRQDLDRTTKRLGLLAIVLVAFQGTLGGITVKLNLSWVVSTMHLVLAMIFFSLLIVITGRVMGSPAQTSARSVGPRGLVAVAALLVGFQIALGGLVRHLGAGWSAATTGSAAAPAPSGRPVARRRSTCCIASWATPPPWCSSSSPRAPPQRWPPTDAPRGWRGCPRRWS
jgi:cytochrome c oxidase assembly protein subunit 15